MNNYEILGVGEASSLTEIKKAYKKLAQQFHPDKTRDNGEKFKQIKFAYDSIVKERSTRSQESKKAAHKKSPSPSDFSWKNFTGRANTQGEQTSYVHHVELELSQIFGNSLVKLAGTNFYVSVPALVKNHVPYQLRARTLDNANFLNTTVTFNISDFDGFYTINNLDGERCLWCQVNLTIAAMLAETKITLRNPNPNLNDIIIKASVSTKIIKVPFQGLPGVKIRGNLYVEQVIDLKSLSEEIYPTLIELKMKIDELIDSKEYKQHINK